VIFHPTTRGRMFASVRDEGLYISNDAGQSWSKQGLDGSVVNRLKFGPVVGQ